MIAVFSFDFIKIFNEVNFLIANNSLMRSLMH